MKMAVFTDREGSKVAINPTKVEIYSGEFPVPQAEQEIGRPAKKRYEVRLVWIGHEEGWVSLHEDITFEKAVEILDEALNWAPWGRSYDDTQEVDLSGKEGKVYGSLTGDELNPEKGNW